MATSLVDLNDLYQFLNFLINKFLGTFYAPEQMDLLVDRAQMAVYNDYYSEFGKSQQLNDSLAPFKRTFVFTQSSSPGGLITPPRITITSCLSSRLSLTQSPVNPRMCPLRS